MELNFAKCKDEKLLFFAWFFWFKLRKTFFMTWGSLSQLLNYWGNLMKFIANALWLFLMIFFLLHPFRFLNVKDSLLLYVFFLNASLCTFFYFLLTGSLNVSFFFVPLKTFDISYRMIWKIDLKSNKKMSEKCNLKFFLAKLSISFYAINRDS